MKHDTVPPIVMVRHATPARRKAAEDAFRLVDVGRPNAFGLGPNDAEFMVPWLKTWQHRTNVPWLICVRFKDEAWVHCLSSSAELIPIERLGSTKALHILATWYAPDENRTYARFYKAGALAGELTVAGRGADALDVQQFRSSAHPKTLLKRCKTAREAVEAFFSAVEAELRDIQVASIPPGLELRGAGGRAIPAKELAELGIVYVIPLTAAENPASVALMQAIESADVAGARKAIADGASLEFLPDLLVSPLAIAFDSRRPGDWIGVAKALVKAGAPIDGYDWEDPPIFSAFSAMGKEQIIIKNLEPMLSLGANIDAPSRTLHEGSTILHMAVTHHYADVVEFLLRKGARCDVRDKHGMTPLELAESWAKDDPPYDPDADDSDESTEELSPMEQLARSVSGSPRDNIRRRARVVQLLREATAQARRR